jgi:hypothetical protein
MKHALALIKKALPFALTLSMAASAFAAWPSFQNTNTNNGVVTVAPPITTPTVTPVSLTNNGAWTGVDSTSVINSGVSYTLYNGGATSGSAGGARVQATNLSTGASVWNIQLDAQASNVSQLSTPYYTNGNIYAAETYYVNILTDTSGWELNGTAVTFPVTIPTGTSILTYTGTNLDLPAAYHDMQIDTGINTSSTGLSAATTVTSGGNTYDLGTSSSYGGEFIIYNANSPSVTVPAGLATLSITISNTTGGILTSDGVAFNISEWALYSVVASSGAATLLANGYGQANTPISYDIPAGKYLYWGIWDGDRTYYEYAIGGGVAPTPLANVTDDFYGTGAASVNNNGYMVFGSDSGTVYIAPVSGFSGGTANSFTVASGYQIRSSIAVDNNGTNAYFTAYNLTAGNLYQVAVSSLVSGPTPVPAVVTLTNASTSTPVISANGYVYVGTYNSFTSGTVEAVLASSFSGPPINIYSGAPVQSSAIVYSANTLDYVYFTTNLYPRGSAFCFRNITGSSTVTQMWTYLGQNSAVQGFASDAGILVYGDDSNTLYIFS